MNQEDENKDRRKFFILPFAIKFSHLISSDCSSLFGLGWRKEKKLDGGVLHVQLCLSSSAKKTFVKRFFFLNRFSFFFARFSFLLGFLLIVGGLAVSFE